MRTRTPWFRLTAAAVAGALLLAPVLPSAAWAQSEGGDNLPATDPPATVGRVANLRGTVSFHTADQTEWQPAALNYPVTAGGSYWTEPGSGAELEVGATRLVMDQSTELDVNTLDDHALAVTVPQGGLYLGLRDVLPGETTTITTPRGQVTIGTPGRYVVEAGDAGQPTSVTVLDGAAQVYGNGVSLQVGPQQTATITGTDVFQGSLGPQRLAPFAAAELARERPVPTGEYAPPPLVAQMTGGDALVDTGTWEPTPEYGRVWFPPVAVGWVPYRHGHWAWVAPWGWTWIDDAPWGFAPFHYGRWVEMGPRWGWVPVEPGISVVVRPVYAPALVTFIGLGVGVAMGASVGWIPLGPREVYRPPYRVSNTYIRRVNVTNVVNVTNITNVHTTNVFMNRRAATVVPAAAMVGSERVGRRAQQISPQALAAARPLAAPPVRPTRATAGVTPAVARQMNLPPVPAGAVRARPAAPGPAVRPAGPGGAPLQRAGMPGVVAPGQPRPGAPGPAQPRPGAPGPARPGPTQPFLRQPGGAAPNAAGLPANRQPPVAQPRPGAPGPAQPGATQPFLRQPGGAAPNAAGLPASRPSPMAQPRPGAPGPAQPGPTQPGFGQRPGQLAPGQQPGLPPLRQPGAGRPQPGLVTPGAPGPQRPQPPAVQRPAIQHPGMPQAPVQPFVRPVPQPGMAPNVQRAPAPQVHAAPPPVMRAPPPQVHAAPPPPPQQHRQCPPGRPGC